MVANGVLQSQLHCFLFLGFRVSVGFCVFRSAEFLCLPERSVFRSEVFLGADAFGNSSLRGSPSPGGPGALARSLGNSCPNPRFLLRLATLFFCYLCALYRWWVIGTSLALVLALHLALQVVGHVCLVSSFSFHSFLLCHVFAFIAKIPFLVAMVVIYAQLLLMSMRMLHCLLQMLLDRCQRQPIFYLHH